MEAAKFDVVPFLTFAFDASDSGVISKRLLPRPVPKFFPCFLQIVRYCFRSYIL